MTVGQTQVVLLSLRENCGQDVSELDSVGGWGWGGGRVLEAALYIDS